jgi:hypothetical protein
LRHTFATEALAASISTFELSRVMGTSLVMIDRTYGHLARYSEASIRARLDARGAQSGVKVASGGRVVTPSPAPQTPMVEPSAGDGAYRDRTGDLRLANSVPCRSGVVSACRDRLVVRIAPQPHVSGGRRSSA